MDFATFQLQWCCQWFFDEAVRRECVVDALLSGDIKEEPSVPVRSACFRRYRKTPDSELLPNEFLTPNLRAVKKKDVLPRMSSWGLGINHARDGCLRRYCGWCLIAWEREAVSWALRSLHLACVGPFLS